MDFEKRMKMAGKYPLVTFRVRRKIKRPKADVVAKFENFFVPDISDQVGRLYTMDSSIRPLYSPPPRLLGTAVTVKCPPGDNMGMKEALNMIEPGDVLVIDAMGFMEWCLGGFHTLVIPIRQRGLKGLMVNGAFRDASQGQMVNFPMYGKGIAAWSGPKRGPFEINVPVCCGGVIIHPGDLVVADEDGAVVVPQDYIQAVADRLASYPGKEHPEDMIEKELAQKEANRREYFEMMFKEKNGVYLD